jgi:hypothetical protein
VRTRLASLWLAALAAGALPAGATDVTYAARVDEQGRVFVDVSNATQSPVRVTTFVLRFFGAGDAFLERATSDCEDDCTVAADATEAFGPFETPEGWETVHVDEVFYDGTVHLERAPAHEAPAPGASPAAPAPGVPPRPTARPQAPAAPGPATSPEAALRELYRRLVRGDYARARQMCSASAGEGALAALGEAGFAAWAEKETKGATVLDVRLLEPFGESPAGVRVEVAYADGSKAVRRVHFRQEDGGWKIERIEESR